MKQRKKQRLTEERRDNKEKQEEETRGGVFRGARELWNGKGIEDGGAWYGTVVVHAS